MIERDEEGGIEEDLAQLETILTRLRERAARQNILRLVVDQDGPTYASYAQAVVEGRMRLKRFVPGSYFSDPAFDMLLDLFVATERGSKRSFKAAALASRVPPATAARYIDMMARDGIVVRETDPADGRRTALSLSASAMNGMRRWLASISSIPLRREWRD